MIKGTSLVYLRLFSCVNRRPSGSAPPLRRATGIRGGGSIGAMMAKRQNSAHNPPHPSSIYPRLQSVDLRDDEEECARTETSEDIDFEDHADAFRSKSTWEILRALAILRMCSVNLLVDNSLKMMRWVERVCGRRMLGLLFKRTLYDQFVGGEDANEIRSCVRRLGEAGMRAMLAATMEEDVGEGSDDEVYESNASRILQSIEIAAAGDNPSPMIQLKLSGLLPAELLVNLGNRYTSSANKVKLIRALAQGLTGNEIDISPFADIIDHDKKNCLNKAIKRLKAISLEAKNRGVKVLVDAEQTYLNPGLSLLTLAAGSTFNQESAVIWNTYQCYLKDARQKLQEESDLVLDELKCHFGAKVVRGAYMAQERCRADKLQIADPVCEDYEATGKNYNDIVLELLKKKSELGSRCQFMVASHNEESVKLVLKKMHELKVDRQHGGVYFAQLYGMCDQVTNPLANAGYAVYKSIPFGRVDEVLPYLARRAVENKSVLEGARKEKVLLSKELKQRIGRKLTCRGSENAGSTT